MEGPKFMNGETRVETVAWMMDNAHKDRAHIDINGYRFCFTEEKLQDLLTVVYALLRQIDTTEKQNTLKDLQEIVEMIGDLQVPGKETQH